MFFVHTMENNGTKPLFANNIQNKREREISPQSEQVSESSAIFRAEG